MQANADLKRWDLWLGRLYNLRRDKQGSHERPHKPVLLLSIINLMDRGFVRENAVALSEELVETFRRYFIVVKRHNDRPTIENPFYFLSGDGFWQVIPRDGNEPLYREGYASQAPSLAEFRRRMTVGRFDEELWRMIKDPVSRSQLREALIARYFPEDRGNCWHYPSTTLQRRHRSSCVRICRRGVI